jgi:hypothetical protein
LSVVEPVGLQITPAWLEGVTVSFGSLHDGWVVVGAAGVTSVLPEFGAGHWLMSGSGSPGFKNSRT